MTSYEFEKAAKNAVAKLLREEHGVNIAMQDLQFVWFAHLLGYKKCTLYTPAMGRLYAEVTYNRDKDEMYVDLYEKDSNVRITADQFDYSAGGTL